MPELAEVEYYRKQWNCGENHRVVAVQVHAGKRIFRGTNVEQLQTTLPGATLLKSKAHGKQMLFHFSNGGWLGLHLGMTGKLRVEASAYIATKHDHLVLSQERQSLVFSDPRQFGRVLFYMGEEEPPWWKKLGPEVTSKQFTAERVRTFLERHGKIAIKPALLLQSGFPGIGNWMADEILWQAKVHPRTPAGKIGRRVHKLHRVIQFVCREAIRRVGQNYGDVPEHWLFHRRWSKGEHCPRDGTVLCHAQIGGRTTCWCPRCQRLADASGFSSRDLGNLANGPESQNLRNH